MTSVRFGLPYLVVLAIVVIGWLVAAAGDSGYGAALVMAFAVFVAAVLRLVLPEGRAGALAVRRRPADIIILGVLAVGLAAIVLSLRMGIPR